VQVDLGVDDFLVAYWTLDCRLSQNSKVLGSLTKTCVALTLLHPAGTWKDKRRSGGPELLLLLRHVWGMASQDAVSRCIYSTNTTVVYQSVPSK
jgi:hypothetical protein